MAARPGSLDGSKTLVASPSVADKGQGHFSRVLGQTAAEDHAARATLSLHPGNGATAARNRTLRRRQARMNDKAEALSPFRYHPAVEKCRVAPHPTSPEKLTDCFLGRCLRPGVGAPNAADYFPEDSFIPLDIDDRSPLLNDSGCDPRQCMGKAPPPGSTGGAESREEHHLFAVIERIVRQSGHDDSLYLPAADDLRSSRLASQVQIERGNATWSKSFTSGPEPSQKHRFHRQRGSRNLNRQTV